MAKRKKKRIASRGSVNTTILKTLVNGDKYGYEIIKEVERYSEGKIQLKQPSLYSSLSRFEEKGIVSSYWGDSDIGGRRHYYHLTEKGYEYYKVSILKIKSGDSNDTSIDDVESEKILDQENEISETKDINNINDSVVEIVPNNLNNDNDEINQIKKSQIDDNLQSQITLTEINDEEIPAILNFTETPIKSSEQIDTLEHVFSAITPLEKIKKLDNSSTQSEENYQKPIENEKIISTNQSKEKIWFDLVDRVKESNRICSTTPYKKLHYKKPIKTKKVILDKDGIYKLRDHDYTPTTHTTPAKTKIVDNVGKRIVGNNYFDSLYIKKDSGQTTPKELTNEERIKKNQSFEERFNMLTQSKLKPVKQEAPVITKDNSPIADKEQDFDYRSKLDILINTQSSNLSDNHVVEQELEENNIFNYIDNDDLNSSPEHSDNALTELNNEEFEDKYINFDSDDFEIKSENKKYIEEISNFTSNQDSIKISRYENKSFTNNVDSKTFVLINRVKSIFGIILLLLGSIELTASLIFFKNSNLMQDSDLKIFIIGFIIIAIISISFILPVLFNSREHRLNTYKLKYTEILGILTFLVSLILIYCINALIGFDLENFNHFAVELIVPAILTFNFVITPPIYSALINNKRFYD